MDLKIDSNEDLVIEHGDLVFVRGVDAIAQHIRMRLQCWYGESPYDQIAGVPYHTIIFQPNTSKESIRFILQQRVLLTPGVTGVELDFDFDTETRELTVTGTATANDEEIEFTANITPP